MSVKDLTMKKKIVIKTISDCIIVFISVFAIWVTLTLISGKPRMITPSRNATKFKSVPYKEALKEIPAIFFVALGGGLIYFPIGYGYYKNKFQKEEEKTKKRNIG